MVDYYKKILKGLSKEQLIFLLEQFERSSSLITEVCVEESKCHISSDKAVDEIRRYIYHLPSENNVIDLKAFIDMKMGKISALQCRKIMGFDD
jgi:hypothetical protein